MDKKFQREWRWDAAGGGDSLGKGHCVGKVKRFQTDNFMYFSMVDRFWGGSFMGFRVRVKAYDAGID